MRSSRLTGGLRRDAELFVLLLALFLCCASHMPLCEGAAEGKLTKNAGEVVEITDSNYDNLIHDGPWMVVVSASWCPHCKQLEPTWVKLAEKLRGKVRVGKIDGPENKILSKRLHVVGYPTIFHVDRKGLIRDYGDQARDLEKLYQFAVSGYKQYEPLPWYHTPHSLFGQICKQILELPRDLQEMYSFLHIDLGLSDVFIIFSGIVLPLIGGVFVIGAMDLFFVRFHCRSLGTLVPAQPNNRVQ
ncbi:thioredoxin domain-containing protein [Chloropicon primus]|uniref:Thioredoxin domain-containing protein n=1 Tax=Chloropicon primus TaxID=1764295 RepID=A0A5B8MU99_9CHLO|nr:thioredoxin domain-containing protein [Chloropicon primus]UPR03301.1 thioredoxin domain-containing protein [Chloropicon primus]|mmetsp:Transcript_35525/g.77214  ORF Transcript_35525/g.77214 Transcript_35525/m.77214 type:complete len:244 (+) Transcript_35525:203-934(+)|eukprot:QDZ24093.1 thioredoxin domain-containing protein [Chloropicon primus]